jgi:hypothetical protein
MAYFTKESFDPSLHMFLIPCRDLDVAVDRLGDVLRAIVRDDADVALLLERIEERLHGRARGLRTSCACPRTSSCGHREPRLPRRSALASGVRAPSSAQSHGAAPSRSRRSREPSATSASRGENGRAGPDVVLCGRAHPRRPRASPRYRLCQTPRFAKVFSGCVSRATGLVAEPFDDFRQ